MSIYQVFSLLIIFGMTSALSAFIAFSTNRSLLRYKNTKRLWDDSLISAIYLPLQLAVWLWGLSLFSEIVISVSNTQFILPALFKTREAGTVFLFSWFLYRFVTNIEFNYRKNVTLYESKLDQTTVDALSKILKILILFFTALFSLKYFFNMSLTGLWTITGAGSIIVGFAAKDMLANFFGAMMIYFNRPFSIGDLIQTPNKEVEGIIEHIGWRATRIRTLEATTVYVPNSVFSTVSVENRTRRTHRRISEIIEIQYGDLDKLNNITAYIEQMLSEHPKIDRTKLYYANILELGASCIRVRIYAYTHEIDDKLFQEIKQDILIKTMLLIQKSGAQLPSNVQSIQLINYRPINP